MVVCKMALCSDLTQMVAHEDFGLLIAAKAASRTQISTHSNITILRLVTLDHCNLI
jgi:hypothetical protein